MRDVKEVHTTVCRHVPSPFLGVCVCVCMRDVKEVHTTVCRHAPSPFLGVCVYVCMRDVEEVHTTVCRHVPSPCCVTKTKCSLDVRTRSELPQCQTHQRVCAGVALGVLGFLSPGQKIRLFRRYLASPTRPAAPYGW